MIEQQVQAIMDKIREMNDLIAQGVNEAGEDYTYSIEPELNHLLIAMRDKCLDMQIDNKYLKFGKNTYCLRYDIDEFEEVFTYDLSKSVEDNIRKNEALRLWLIELFNINI